TTRIVCRFLLLQPLVGLAMPFFKRWRDTSPARIGAVAVMPAAPPEERPRQDEPEQDEEQNGESKPKAPRAVPIGKGWDLSTLCHQLLGQPMRESHVIRHNRGNRAQQHDADSGCASEATSVHFLTSLNCPRPTMAKSAFLEVSGGIVKRI